MSDSDALKECAGRAAMQYVTDGMKIGLGTGSTAKWFVIALSEAVKAGLEITACSTSVETTHLAQAHGLVIDDVDAFEFLDVVVDGADEIGPELSLIKGGGAALLREKLVWELSRLCIVIADETKCVPHLGRFALPLEVEPFGMRGTKARIAKVLQDHGIDAKMTMRLSHGTPLMTDGHNHILDIHAGHISDPHGLGRALKSITGVVEHGLFLGMASKAIIATKGGVIIRTP